MTSSIYLFAQDVADEGLSAIADAGLESVTVAATYHHARDVLPHNPRRKVSYMEGGVAYFTPSSSYGALSPVASASAFGLAEVCDAASAASLKTSAWLVVLHNSRLGTQHPEATQKTAFGDPLTHALCPANPDVQRFATELVRDVARFPFDAIKLEAVSYQPFDHGVHHERSFIPLSPNIRYLLGLCFCEHCRREAQRDNVDVDRLRRFVVDRVQAVFDSASNETAETELDEAWLFSLPEFEGFARTRQRVVTRLVAALRAATDTPLTYLDPSGATLGYATGRPATPKPATAIAWRDGIDLPSIAQTVDQIGVLAYFADDARLAAELAAYQALGSPLEVISRPMSPDVLSSTALVNRVRTLRDAGVADVSFYHYAFMRLESLGWIKEALTADRTPTRG